MTITNDRDHHRRIGSLIAGFNSLNRVNIKRAGDGSNTTLQSDNGRVSPWLSVIIPTESVIGDSPLQGHRRILFVATRI